MKRGDYKDLGQVVEGLSMAAGAAVSGSWIDDVAWVRNIILLSQSDQQYDLIIFRRDTAGTVGWGSTVWTNLALTSTQWRESAISTSAGAATSGISSILGASAKFGIKNSSASPNTYGRVRVQLMGL